MAVPNTVIGAPLLKHVIMVEKKINGGPPYPNGAIAPQGHSYSYPDQKYLCSDWCRRIYDYLIVLSEEEHDRSTLDWIVESGSLTREQVSKLKRREKCLDKDILESIIKEHFATRFNADDRVIAFVEAALKQFPSNAKKRAELLNELEERIQDNQAAIESLSEHFSASD